MKSSSQHCENVITTLSTSSQHLACHHNTVSSSSQHWDLVNTTHITSLQHSAHHHWSHHQNAEHVITTLSTSSQHWTIRHTKMSSPRAFTSITNQRPNTHYKAITFHGEIPGFTIYIPIILWTGSCGDRQSWLVVSYVPTNDRNFQSRRILPILMNVTQGTGLGRWLKFGQSIPV